jgi:ABC-2 type transport system permease protein
MWKGRLVKFTMLVALVPALALATFVSLWGLIEQKASIVAPLINLFTFNSPLFDSPRDFRVAIWTMAFFFFFQVQLFIGMILVLQVGPSLISQDLRFNAIPLYLSKPLRRLDYFLGKFGVIAVFLGAVAILPALLAYLLGLSFSLDLTVVRDTWKILAAAMAYGCIIVLSAGTLMLALSSLSRNSRYVGGMWVGIWILSGLTAGILSDTVRKEWCPVLSYPGNLRRLGEVLLDTKSATDRLQRVLPRPGSGPPSFETPPGGRNRPGRINRPPPPPFEPPRLPAAPWTWCALVLAGLFGNSLWFLTFRVITLDRLK